MNITSLYRGHPRLLALSVGTVLLLLLVARFFVIPFFAPELSLTWLALLALIAQALVVSLTTTTFIAGLVHWLNPEILRNTDVRAVPPIEIKQSLRNQAHTSDMWMYSGGKRGNGTLHPCQDITSASARGTRGKNSQDCDGLAY